MPPLCDALDLAARHRVSRKFVYQQTHKARVALAGAFLFAVPEGEVLFELAVTKTWLHQVIVALPLICHSSYRGVVEFMRDLLGTPISVGAVHHVLQSATRQADVINNGQDLSGIRVGLHDEIFHGPIPVLAGVDAASTYCYLLTAEEHRDADTWAVHLLDATKQGLKPDYTIADAGHGLRAGQKVAWDDTPCHGDVFHIQSQCEGLANTLSRLAKGVRSQCEKLQAKIDDAGRRGPDDELATQLQLMRQTETSAYWLARDIRTLTQWLSHDVLALAGPALATRQVLFDFIVEELARREPEDAGRIRPLRVALQNQRDDLLAFAGVLDAKLASVAKALEIHQSVVREACVLQRLPSTSSAYWQGWNRVRAKTGCKFQAVFDAVSRAMAQTPRSSSLVENLNSRLRNYFTLRRHLGGSYLDLLRFFLNHRRFMRSRRAERNGRSPRELMTGQDHPHWLTLLGLGLPQPRRALPRGGWLLPAQDNLPTGSHTGPAVSARQCNPQTADSEPRLSSRTSRKTRATGRVRSVGGSVCSMPPSIRYGSAWGGPSPGRTNSNGFCCALSSNNSATTGMKLMAYTLINLRHFCGA